MGDEYADESMDELLANVDAERLSQISNFSLGSLPTYKEPAQLSQFSLASLPERDPAAAVLAVGD